MTDSPKFKIHGIQIMDIGFRKVKFDDNEMFNFLLDTSLSFQPDSGSIVVFNKVTIRVKDQNDPVASITVGIGFVIEDFKNIVQFEGNIARMPSELEYQMKNISISTLRGIMFAEFKGTQMHNAILPLINLRPAEEEQKEYQESDTY